MNADNILFRCSSLGYLMTEGKKITDKQLIVLTDLQSRKKKLTDKQKETLEKLIDKRDNPELSDGTKTHLVDVFVREKYNRFTELHAKQLDKGNDTEEDSITVVARIIKQNIKKNKESLSNKYIKGTPDIYIGEYIRMAEIIHDTKSSWNIFTYQRAIAKELDDKNFWQGTGYMWLTGAKKCFIDYCLNNTPYYLVSGELRRESYNHDEGNTPAWIELQIIANHVYDKKTFDDYISKRGILIEGDENCKAIYHGFVEVPLSERHFAFEFERNDDDIKKLQARIIKCREWMNTNLFKVLQPA
jgi:hypothetical protein